jgi:NAD(P)-dependent dehydrogenase (short-subunit alcohol dehydrogenase family)
MRLKGKTAIITGGGRGLGRASAIAMAREGASLLILSRTPTELRETKKAIGQNAVSLKADVAKPRDVDRAVETALSAFGGIDILMNNAAVIGPVKPLHKVEKEEWDAVFSINLRGLHLFSKAVVPHMIKRGAGKIINVTSGLGEMVMPPFGAYSVTKGGVNHLTQIMAEELKGYNIQVNCLDPGIMDTRMQEEIRNLGPGVLGRGIHKEFMGFKEHGYLDPPEKAAALAVFLASGESDSLTGMNGTGDDYQQFGYKGES